MDQLLQNENDVSGPAAPYAAAIPKYRVTFIKPEEATHLDKIWNLANGHAVQDIQHPCCHAGLMLLFDWKHTPASDRSCIHLEFDITRLVLSMKQGIMSMCLQRIALRLSGKLKGY